MAEVIGVLASGLTIGSLAASITSNTVKLKSYWDQVQNAPEDIHDLIEEVEIFNHLLAAVADDQQQNAMSSLIFDSTSMSRCLQHCQAGADRLKELTDKLSFDLDASTKAKRKWASAKVVLKKVQVDRHKAKLQGAIRLLSLSHQIYTRALLQIQPNIIVAKLSQSTKFGQDLNESSDPDLAPALHLNDAEDDKTITTPAAANPFLNQSWNSTTLFGTVRYSKCRYAIAKRMSSDYEGRKQECEAITAQYYGPHWLTNRTWRIRAIKTSFGWSFLPRTYNVIPSNSAVFTFARRNDVKGLQSLFGRREASPFDCDQYDYTPLTAVAASGKYDVCEFLIRFGADPDHDSDGMTALDLFIGNTHYIGDNREVTKIPRLLLNETERESDLGWYRGPKEGFSLWQQALEPFFYQKPLVERIEVAFQVAFNGISPDVLRLSMARGPLPSLAHSTKDSLARTFLHAIATGMGRTLCWNRFSLTEVLNPSIVTNPDKWQPLLKDLVVQGANVHFISYEVRTPFLDLFWGLDYDTQWDYSASDLTDLEPVEPMKIMRPSRDDTGDPNGWTATMTQKIHLLLQTWLVCLQESGVDIEDYGRKEIEARRQGLVSWTWISELPNVDAVWFLTILSYGPSPSDWKIDIEWRQATAEVPGKMPGGWVDDDGSEADN